MAPGLVLVYRPEKESPTVFVATGLVAHVTADEFLDTMNSWSTASGDPDPLDPVSNLHVVEVSRIDEFLRVLTVAARNAYPVIAIVDSGDCTLQNEVMAKGGKIGWPSDLHYYRAGR